MADGSKTIERGMLALGSMLEMARATPREARDLDGKPPFDIPPDGTIEVWRTRPGVGGEQARISFPNGYEASIVRGIGSYGVEENPWELAVCTKDGIVYDTPITDDVIGHLTDAAVTDLLYRISALPLRDSSEQPAAGPSGK